MKKSIKKMISVIIIFSILVSTVFVLTSSADQETYSSSADKYFSELKINIPANIVGSCGYVAMSMLLAYYDTYWNDSFVGAQYDLSAAYTESTLVNGYSTIRTENNLFTSQYNQYVASGGTLSRDEYYINFVNMYQNAGYLHLDLIGIGIDEGYYDGLFQNDEYASTLYETGIILDAYFDDIFGEYFYFDPYGFFNPADAQLPLKINYLSTSDGYSSDYVISKMAELVESGIPVMYRGARYADGYTGNELFPKKTGHVIIAYDVIKENGEVVDFVMHTGWRNTMGEYAYCQNLSDLPYNMDIGILWFEVNDSMIPHGCSNNYVLPDGGVACACEIHGDLHPEHVHSNSGTLKSSNATSHTYECVWGDLITETHNHASVSIISNSLHKSTCSCGYEYTEMHFFKQTSPRYSSCIYCGYTRDEWGSGGNIIMGTENEEESE